MWPPVSARGTVPEGQGLNGVERAIVPWTLTKAEASTTPDHRLRFMTKPDLVDLQLIAKRLGVPYDTVNKWRFRGVLPPPDYPELRNPIWDWETIEAWAKTTDRLPDKEAPNG